MKKFILLVLAMLSFFIYASAQSLDKALEQLKIVREQCGEQSQEYFDALKNVIDRYVVLSDKEKVLQYSSQLETVSVDLYGFDGCKHLNTLYDIANFNLKAGNTLMAAFYCSKIIDNDMVVDSCNYYYIDEAFKFLKAYYDSCGQIEQKRSAAFKHFNAFDSGSSDLSFFNEKMNSLFYLIGAVDNTRLAFEYSVKAENYIKDYSRIKEIELFKIPQYYPVISFMATYLFLKNDFNHGLQYYHLCREYLIQNEKTDSKEYFEALVGIIECAAKAGMNNTVMELASEMPELIYKYSDYPIEDDHDFALKFYTSSLRLGKYEDALTYCDKSYYLSKQIEGHDSLLAKATYALVKAQVFHEMGKNSEALSFIHVGLKDISDAQDSISLITKSQLFDLESLVLSNFDDALVKSDSALFICESLIERAKTHLSIESEGSDPMNCSPGQIENETIKLIHWLDKLQIEYSRELFSRGLVYYNHGMIAEAYSIFLEVSSIIENNLTESSTPYISCQNNIASCEMGMGYYSDAINRLSNLESVVVTNYGTSSQQYANVL